MKTFKIDLPKQDIEIIPLADLHLGDPLCAVEEIKRVIEYIRITPNCYCVLNGDLINNATKSSVSDIYGEILKPMDQLSMASFLLEPIKDKILCMTTGNHEVRTYKQDGIDLMEVLATQLGVNYSPTSALLFIKLGNEKNTHYTHSQGHYTLFLNHGSGGGRSEGSSINKLTSMASIVDADIYIHSHTHVPAIVRNSYYRTNDRARTATQVDKLFVNTNAFLNYGGYADMFEYKPTSRSVPVIKLKANYRFMEAKV